MKPPLFLWEPNDLNAFESAEELESYVEAEDVESGAFAAAYDSEGRILELSVTTVEKRVAFFLKSRIKRVMVRAAEEEPSHAASLREVLLQYARHIADKIPFESDLRRMPLDELAPLIAAHCRPRIPRS